MNIIEELNKRNFKKGTIPFLFQQAIMVTPIALRYPINTLCERHITRQIEYMQTFLPSNLSELEILDIYFSKYE